MDPRRLLIGVIATAALLGGPAATGAGAVSGPWPVRTVATGGPAFHRDVAGLPGGRIATLLERHVGRASRLELWTGTRRTLIAASARGHFFEAELAADARGRVVVAFDVVPDAGGARRAYAWTAAHGVQALTAGPRSATTVELAVAPDGRAAIAVPFAGTAIRVARGSAEGGFAPAGIVTTANASWPTEVGIAADGTVTVGWETEDGLALARAAWAGPFAAPVPVALAHVDEWDMAVTRGGRAVVGAKTTERLLSGASARAVATFAWDPGAAAPSGPVVVSHGQTGTPSALAVRDTGFVVWRQARTTHSGPTTLAAATYAADGTRRVRFTIPGRGGAGGPLGLVTLAPAGGGVRAYFGVGGSVHTTHVDARGVVSGAGVALGSGEGRPYVAAAEAGERPVIVFTRQLFEGNAGFRVRIARPR